MGGSRSVEAARRRPATLRRVARSQPRLRLSKKSRSSRCITTQLDAVTAVVLVVLVVPVLLVVL